jgi:endo-1,4-beta-D-glucanase Y
MLACRPRPVSPRLSSLHFLLLLALAPACAPSEGGPQPTGTAGAAGGATAGSGGSPTGGTTGRGGAGGDAAGSGGASSARGGDGGSTAGGSGGSTGGSVAGRGGATAGSSGSGGAAAGSSGGAGTAGSAGRGGSGGATAGSGGTVGGGAGGSSGGGSTGAGGSAATVCNGGPPSAPSGGANFPFPQHRAAGACIFPPSCTDADMMAGWTAYKAALIVPDGSDGSMRVTRPSDGNDTVSEGISYGMLFSVYMNDKATFDALWKYEQKHLNTNGLMHWKIASNGSTTGMNSATDADEDIAFALVMADKQWGGYTTTATNMINTVAAKDFGADGTIKGGDMYVAVNPSYIAPAFYRAFAAYVTDATQKARWMTILDKNYEILASVQNATSGLVPDWSAGPATNTNYGYDATRTPFRVALDYCWNGDTRAKTFSDKIGAFFAGIGAANIVDGYNVNGTVTGSNKNSVFIGPAGAAGMASGKTQLVADAYARVVADAKGANAAYYDRSWALFTVMLMTGNFVNFQSL